MAVDLLKGGQTVRIRTKNALTLGQIPAAIIVARESALWTGAIGCRELLSVAALKVANYKLLTAFTNIFIFITQVDAII